MRRFFSPKLRRQERVSPPSWRGTPRGRRILVEHRDPVARGILERRLRESGYDAVSCPGPGGSAGRVSCPLLRQESCPAVDDADAIVAALDFRDDANRLVAARASRARPDLPLFLDTPDDVADQWGMSFPHERAYRISAPSLIRRLDAMFGVAA